MENYSLIVYRWITTSFVHLLGPSSHSPGGQFTLPELVYFIWYHNCTWKFCTVLHKQISKHFLPLLETEVNSHLPSLSLPFPLRAHFCLHTRFSLFGFPKATFPLAEAEKNNQNELAGEKAEKGREGIFCRGKNCPLSMASGLGCPCPGTTGPAERPQHWGTGGRALRPGPSQHGHRWQLCSPHTVGLLRPHREMKAPHGASPGRAAPRAGAGGVPRAEAGPGAPGPHRASTGGSSGWCEPEQFLGCPDRIPSQG